MRSFCRLRRAQNWPKNHIVSGQFLMFLSCYSIFSSSLGTESTDVGHKKEWFANSTDEHVDWVNKGTDLFAAYMAKKGKYNSLL